MKWTQLQVLALKWKAWIQRQLFEDDPWDVETLFPESDQFEDQSEDHAHQKDESSGISNAKLSDAESVKEKNLRARHVEQKNRSDEE